MDLSASSLTKQGSVRVNLVRKLLGSVLASSGILLATADNRSIAEDLAKPVVVAPAMKQEREIFDDFRRLELVLEQGLKSGIIPRDLEEELLQSQDQLMNFKADRHYVTFTSCLIEQLAKSKPLEPMLRALLTTNNPNISSHLLRLFEFGDLNYDQVLKLAASARLQCRKTNADLQNCFVHLDKEYKFQLEEILPTVINNRVEAGLLSEQVASSLIQDMTVAQKLQNPKLGAAVAELYTVLDLYSKDKLEDKELAAILDKLRGVTKGEGFVPDDVCLILSFMKEDLLRQRHNEQSPFKETTLLVNFNKLYEAFVSSNEERLTLMQNFCFLKDNIKKFYPLTEEKIKHILLVQKEIEQAIVDGLIPKTCNFSGGFYMSRDSVTFLSELRRASQQAEFKPISEDIMRSLAKIDSPNMMIALISLYQQNQLSSKELLAVTEKVQRRFPYIHSIYLSGGEVSAIELSVLNDVLSTLAVQAKKEVPEVIREKYEDGDAKPLTKEQLFVQIEKLAELLGVRSCIRGSQASQKTVSIVMPSPFVASTDITETEAVGTGEQEVGK